MSLFTAPPTPPVALNAQGLLDVSVVTSVTPAHPISVQHPLEIFDFPEGEEGQLSFTALRRILAFLSHGFLDPDSNPMSSTSRDLWLRTTLELLAGIHNSIRRTNGDFPLPKPFSDLPPASQHALNQIAKTCHTLNSYFTNYQSETSSWETCMRCLEECHVPMSQDNPRFQALLMSTGQNVRAMQHSMANKARASFAGDLDTWHKHHFTRIKDAVALNIMNEASTDIRLFLDPDTDPRLIEWISRTSKEIRSIVRANLLNEVFTDTLTPWAIEALVARKAEELAKIDREVAKAATQRRIDTEAEAETDAFKEAKSFYKLRLAQLKAEAEADAQHDLTTFHAELWVKTDTCKNNARTAADAAIAAATPLPPARLSADTNQKSRKGTRNELRHDPIMRAKRSGSRARPRTPNLESPTTPKASPAVEPPPRTLKETPMEVEVGPPSNSLELLIATVPDVTLPQSPPSHISPVLTEPQTPADPASLAIQSMLQSFSLSILTQIDQRLAPLSSQLSTLTSDVEKLNVTIQGLFFAFCPPPSFPDHVILHPVCHLTHHLTRHLTHHLTNHMTSHLTHHQDTGSYCPPNWDTLLFSFLIVPLSIVLHH